jgi:RNA polymerase-interacting CarD/CdnL/TRCF family regulator
MPFKVNDQVISTNFGIGVVTGLEVSSFGPEQYFSVLVKRTNAKVLIPQNSKQAMRIISKEDEIVKALENFKPEIYQNFPCKKDRVLHFKKVLGRQSLDERMHLIAHLTLIEDKGKVEQTILQSACQIFQKEIEYVLGVDEKMAIKIIENFCEKIKIKPDTIAA